jgi:predicted permease
VFPAWPINPATVTLDADSRQVWVPIPHTPELDASGRSHVFGVVARLAPGVEQGEAVERLDRAAGDAAGDAHRAVIQPLREQFVSGARAPLLALAGASLCVLLVACINLAALCGSAFESRRGELAVRLAIGASVGRVVRQLVIEAAVFAAAGAIGGLALARVAFAGLPSLLPPSIPLLTAPALDPGLAAFAAMVAALASAVLAGWPIARIVSASPSPRGTVPSSRSAVHRVLVAAQVAITVALVTAAGLLGQSLRTIERRDTGFSLARTLVADIGLPAAQSDPQAIAAAEARVLDAVARRPGVRAVAAAYDHPLEANWSETLTLVGDSTAPDQRQDVELRIVSPGYFEALDVELVDGRTPTVRDTLDSSGVAVVNEALARAIGGTVLGRRLRSAAPRFTFGAAAAAEFEIVGVVGNERFHGLEQPTRPAYYLSTRQFPQTALSLLVRTAGDPLAAADDVRAAIRDADPSATVARPTSLDRILAGQLAQRRVTTDVIGSFASAALVLAALGMYGLLAVLVGSRTREIGIRLAVGASPASMARHVFGLAVRDAAAGVVIGCGLALAAGSLLQGLLVDVSARDPMTLAAVAGVLLAVAVAASLVPAIRAARVDPVDALRAE